MILIERNEGILHLKLNAPPVNVVETAALKEPERGFHRQYNCPTGNDNC